MKKKLEKITKYTRLVKKEQDIKEHLKNIKFSNTKILIDKLEIWDGTENSYCLVFHIKKNDDLKRLEETFNPFELDINNYGLFEIYPAKLISTYKN